MSRSTTYSFWATPLPGFGSWDTLAGTEALAERMKADELMFVERLRIDPPTPPGKKGPNTSHYHRDGKGKHYSPAPGDKDPGFNP